jgi:localization factor PodJL
MKDFAPAQYRLGTFYERELGVRADLTQAKVWYRRAAEGGNVKAMHNLTVLNAGRDGSRGLFNRVGAVYRSGRTGTARQPVQSSGALREWPWRIAESTQAFKWFSIAALAGDKEAARRRDAVAGQLGALDLQRAETLVRSWRAKPADPTNDFQAASEASKTCSASSG